jgi:Tat protein translocase TatB subunit
MFNIGPLELMVILVIALVVVGPKRLPEVGKTIGKSLREFRKATDEVRQSFDLNFDDDDFDSDPPARSRHVEALPDEDEFPARHVETIPEGNELPTERFEGFEEPETPPSSNGHAPEGATAQPARSAGAGETQALLDEPEDRPSSTPVEPETETDNPPRPPAAESE